MRGACLAILILVPAFGGGCASRFFYYPDRLEHGLPSDSGSEFEAVTFPSRDGTRLSGWFVPAHGEPKGTVIQFHGNAQNMSAHYSFVAWLPAEGFNVFVFDYRGYGKSDGTPNREGVYEDGCAALRYLRSRSDVDPHRILVLGQSLGGTIGLAAIDGAGSDGIRAVALDSAFFSYRTIVRDKIGAVPVIGLLRWPLSFLIISNARSASAVIGDLSPIPVLIMHGTEDRVIPYKHAPRLYARAREPKELVPVPGGRHTEALAMSDPTYRRKLQAFFEQALGENRLH